MHTHKNVFVVTRSKSIFVFLNWLLSFGFSKPLEKHFELNKVIFWVNYLVLFALPLFLDDKSPSMTWGVLFLWQIFWQRSLLIWPTYDNQVRNVFEKWKFRVKFICNSITVDSIIFHESFFKSFFFSLLLLYNTFSRRTFNNGIRV